MNLCLKGIIDQIDGDIVENNEEYNAIDNRMNQKKFGT